MEEDAWIFIYPCRICTWYGCSEEKHDVDEKTLAFIEKAREVHGWKYGYEKVKYVRALDKVVIVCGVHGDFEQTVGNHLRYNCKACAGNDFGTAMTNFSERVKQMGGKVVGEYKGKDIPVKCICILGHQCNPRPNSIRQGGGICNICSEKDSETARHNFIQRVGEFEGKVIGEYKRSDIPVECICSQGHVCYPTPTSVQRGGGICKICASCDFETARAHFIQRVEQTGGKVIGEYRNTNTMIKCICSQGHVCYPRPTSVQQGGGICKICAGCDLETARARFTQRVEQLGGKVIGEYRNNSTPVDCICPQGHPCNPRPGNVNSGQGMCRLCQGIREAKVVLFLQKNLPDGKFIHDRSVGRDIIGPLRPDIRYDCEWYNLIVEVDELAHRSHNGTSENSRMLRIRWMLETPCVFVRYNPDSRDSCLDTLLKTVQKYMNVDGCNPPWDENGLHVEYLFY